MTRVRKRRRRKKKISSPFKKISKNFISKSILIFTYPYIHCIILPCTFEQKKSRSPYIYTLLNNSLPDVLINYAWWKKKIMKKKKKNHLSRPPLFSNRLLSSNTSTLPFIFPPWKFLSLSSPPFPFFFPPFFFRLTSSWRKEQYNRESRTRIFHGARNSRVTTCV